MAPFQGCDKRIDSKQCPRRSGGTTSGLSGSTEVVSIVQRTDAVLKGLVLLVRHHGAKDEIVEQLEKQLHSFLDNSGCETVWLSRIKYVYTYPLAKYLKNDPPPSPDRCFVPTGGLRSWMKERLNALNTTNYRLWCSWLQCKRSTLPLSEDIIEAAYDKHLLTLTKFDNGDDETIRQIFQNRTFLKVIWELRHAVTEAYSASKSFEDWMPSHNSCFENTRAAGGQKTQLAEICGLEERDGDKSHKNLYPLAQTEFFSIEYRPWVYTKTGVSYNFHQERRHHYGHEEWSQLREAALAIDLSKPLNCTIQAVLEPNKVRVISKGNALPYYTCKPLQKALHGCMRQLAPFRLIGRPFLADDLIPLQQNADCDDTWFSVDYSAATDGLSWKYSGKILKFLIQDLPEVDQERAMMVLGPHALHYPVKGGRRDIVLRGVMQNGQLMGSILSFPILCLANFGVYCLATHSRHDREEWSFEDRINHVLINGDDMVYSDKPESWNDLVCIAKKVGLEMSVGKAYVHREYANINSTSVIAPLQYEGVMRTPREVPYLNTGLFFGQHKVQGKTELASQHTKASEGLIVNLNTVLAGSRPGHESTLLKEFLSYHGEKIFDECKVKTLLGRRFVRNLFIPIALGGMGVRPPIGWKWYITKEEVYVAHGFMKMIPACALTAQSPVLGYQLEEKLDAVVNVPWDMQMDIIRDIRVPKRKISCPIVRHYCRTGLIRVVPYKSAALAVEEERKEEFVSHPIPVDLLVDGDDRI